MYLILDLSTTNQKLQFSLPFTLLVVEPHLTGLQLHYLRLESEKKKQETEEAERKKQKEMKEREKFKSFFKKAAPVVKVHNFLC